MIWWQIGKNVPGLRQGARAFRKLVYVHPLVQKALQHQQPVVALESTIITHGMPFPQNLETASEVEQLVRDNGATPATIAIMPGGRIKVGLSDEDLKLLASTPQEHVIKCSRRDLPYVMAQKRAGGTTVAATMIVANMVGVHIFATGGIGGVHRDGQISMDVSADLVELGRTPVAVVCSGVKSILDIPRTLEYLETQGVCVASYGSTNGQFPDFYTRDSGCKAPYNLQDASEAAQLIKALHELQLKSGILIGVPVPEEHAADKQLIESAIKQAHDKAHQQGISGKQLTPFLLAAIAEITHGNSLQANIALIKNNAAVAAQIARALCQHSHYSLNVEKTSQTAPLIVGASILDLSLTILDDMPTTLNGASYHARTKQSAGGVGRNLAEGIFKLYGKANLISAVGEDQFGSRLIEFMPKALRPGVTTVKNKATSMCSIIFDKLGDCKLVLGNMEIHQTITPARLREQMHLFSTAPLIIIDANLSIPTIDFILDIALQKQRPVCFEPTDMRIAGKPFTLPHARRQQIKIVTPNVYELKTIVETITGRAADSELHMARDTHELVCSVRDAIQLIRDEFDCILVTLGQHGVVLSLRGSETLDEPLFDAQTGAYRNPGRHDCNKFLLRFYPAPRVKEIANVSGAGDSFTSGFITGLLRGYGIDNCLAMGFLAAERALQSDSAVPSYYFHSEEHEKKALAEATAFLKGQDIENTPNLTRLSDTYVP